MNSRKKGTLISNGLLGNLVLLRFQSQNLGLILFVDNHAEASVRLPNVQDVATLRAGEQSLL